MIAAVPLYAVTLVDRRTGQPLRVGGVVQTAVTHDPAAVSRQFLRHRDPQPWRIVVRPLVGAA
ncbi:hypothetical protein [Rhodobacter lacus]|uniref:Uncharacterized protein n=1 Tax=Rhodobacter lacus TaxID=1641972 RepID=A0ABW5A9F0_9RHOB